MAAASQVLAYLKALAWPIIVLFAIVLFRTPIRGLLDNIEELEGFGVKAKINRQVKQAAGDSQSALAASPVRRFSQRRPDVVIALNMQRALRFSYGLVDVPSTPPTDQLHKMRLVVDRLDRAIIAVLVAAALPEDRAQAPIYVLSLPSSVEAYMEVVTGYSGWQGIVETRNILRSTVQRICRGSSRHLAPDDVALFISVGDQAFSRLNQLVAASANLVSEQ
jgi:hypothetical protein